MEESASVADALFGKTRQAVLAVLFGDPGREFYLREIVTFAKSGVGQVQRELNRLVRSGLVLREPKGNQVWFRANPDGSVYAELVGIVAKTFGIADFIRMALVPVAAQLRAAFIYGSVARGQHRATSDVDLFVVGDILLSDIDEPIRQAESKMSMKVSPTVIDPKEFAKRRAAGDHFIRSVLAGPKIFIVGSTASLKTIGEQSAR